MSLLFSGCSRSLTGRGNFWEKGAPIVKDRDFLLRAV